MPNSTNSVPRCPEFNSTYGRKCRCDFCKKQAARLQNQYRHRVDQRARGITFPDDKVDPGPSIELIRAAVANGTTQRELEKLTGLQRLVFQRIDDRKWVRRDTADRIRKALAEPDIRAFEPTTKVDAKWTRQMINSLSAQGWTLKHQREIIQNNLNVTAGFLPGISCGYWATTWYANQQAIWWLVQQIGDKKGPSNRAALAAQKAGHFPVKHYDYNGDLIVKSLPKELRQKIEGV